MHTRQIRNPGNGYRAVGSRNSPEGPTRGPGFYNSESRSFSHSFGRNQSQNHRRNSHCPPQAPPMPPRTDVFMEVGRLAAEYLLSKGVLPHDALPEKKQNGSLKKPLSEFQEFRPHELENMQFPGEGRTSALARLGNTGFGWESCRKRYKDDYGTTGKYNDDYGTARRNNVRGKRKWGSYRNNGSDWDREYVRTSSWSDRHRDITSPGMDLYRDFNSRHREEHPARKDNGERMPGDCYSSSRLPEKQQSGKDYDRMDVDKDTGSRLHKELVFGKGDRDMSELIGTSATPLKGVDNEDFKSEIKGKQIEELSEMKDLDVVKNTPDVTNEEIRTDFLDLGSSQQMTDIPLRIPGEEAEVDLRNKGEITGEINDHSKDKKFKEIISVDPTPENFPTYASLSKNGGTDLKELCKFSNVPTRIRSSLAKGAKQRSIVSVEGVDQIGLSESMLNDNNLCISTDNGPSGDCDEPKVLHSVLTPQVVEGDKGLHSDDGIGSARELESGNALGERSNLTNLVSSKIDRVGDSLSSWEDVTMVSHSCPINNFQLPEGMHKPNFVDTEEKLFFHSSFKICDLNLLESSDAHENQDQEAIFRYPTVSAVKKSSSPVDNNLSISNSATSVENTKCVADCMEIEIIDLEGNYAPEHKTLSITERSTEAAFIGLEELSIPVPNTADIPDSQDVYGLMISELLANNLPDVTPDPGDINPLGNVGLHNGEVPLADDDSVCMSFGEMPFLSFSQKWENLAPPQEEG